MSIKNKGTEVGPRRIQTLLLELSLRIEGEMEERKFPESWGYHLLIFNSDDNGAISDQAYSRTDLPKEYVLGLMETIVAENKAENKKELH